MRLGIGSYAYTWSIGVPGSLPEQPMTAEELIWQAGRLGVGVVQIADNLPLDGLTDSELQDLRELAEALNVSIEIGTRGIGLPHLRRYLQIASFLGSPILRIVIDTPQVQPALDEAIAALRFLEQDFKTAGVRLAIENHDRFPCAALSRLVHSLGNDWAGICLDTVNSFGALEGPEVVFRELAPLAINLHVKDFTIFRVSHMMGYTLEGRPAGQGDLDIPRLLQAVSLCGHDPNAILELWTPPEGSLAETISKERRWAVESVAYLRKLIPG